MRAVLASLRVSQWVHFALLPLATFDPRVAWTPQALPLGRGVVTAACVLAFGYLLNAMTDRAVDRDPHKNPLVDEAPTRAHSAALALLAALALCLGALGPLTALLSVLVALVSGTLYSAGPRLKRLPVVGTALNAGCFTPLLFVGVGDAGLEPRHLALASVFAALLLQNQLLHEAADADEDRPAGVRTSFLVLGRRGSAGAALVLGLVALAATLELLSIRGAAWLFAAHAAPYLTLFPLVLARHGDAPATMKRYRGWHRLAAAASGALLYGLAAAAA